MDTFNFKIVTPEKVVFEARVTQATVPTSLGEITVLPHHIPLVSDLEPGEIRIKDAKGQEHLLAVSGGFIEVHPTGIVLLADTAEMAQELQEDCVAEAHKRAKELLEAKGGMRDHEYASLKVMMDKEFARLKVARKYKQRGIRTSDIGSEK